ncbi:hypothetical protein BELL_1126g00020 [Botrytis elliptica]|uniref:Uncharacterized protein n=1 Tax=Botrytis elliptica TaxID=278938 RepID=A0A4Z1IKK0_9HELO|nr:hypothetical protein BELL_1126g00020 [Botrytis elliptica]
MSSINLSPYQAYRYSKSKCKNKTLEESPPTQKMMNCKGDSLNTEFRSDIKATLKPQLREEQEKLNINGIKIYLMHLLYNKSNRAS